MEGSCSLPNVVRMVGFLAGALIGYWLVEVLEAYGLIRLLRVLGSRPIQS